MTARKGQRRLHLLAELERHTQAILVDLACVEEKKLSIALRLVEIERSGMRAVAGYSSITEYGREELGLPPSSTSEMRKVGEGCLTYPQLLEAMRTRRVRWSAGRLIVRAATRETIEEWIEKGERLRIKELAREVHKVCPSYDRPLNDLDQEQVAWVDDAVQLVRKAYGKALRYKDALATFCKLMLNGEGLPGLAGAAGSRPLFVVDMCPGCKQATRRTEEGPVPVPEAELAAARCDAGVIDVREGTGEVKRTVPAEVRRLIEARDHGRCGVPGCGNRVTQLHHMEPWQPPFVRARPPLRLQVAAQERA